MRSLVILLLAGCLVGSFARELTQVSRTCPIDNCATTVPGACATVNGAWQCKTCVSPRVPNAKKNACVCPAGMFPGPSGACRPCKLNFYCPKGNDPLVSTAKACPVNMVTAKTGAKTLADCLNAPGFYYVRKSATVVRALPCPDNTYSKGLDKAPSCVPCMTGFKTDPDNAAGTQTSAAVCVAPPGYFVSGETVVLCPKGEFQPDYAYVSSCKSCEDAVGLGVTTPTVGSNSSADCKWPEQGYMLLDSGGKAVWSSDGTAVTPAKVTGARACPQGYYCVGGDPTVNGNNTAGGFGVPDGKSAGIPQQCPKSLTTEKEGAYSLDQCVAPPGKIGSLSVTVTDCPSGTYKEAYARASSPADGCIPCGTGLWLSEKNYRVAYTDIYGQLLKQELVRGSADSCYIQKGMGTLRTLTTNALEAIICPMNTYGIIGDATNGRKYGVVHTPCTACPANMVTGYDGSSTVQADSIKYVADGKIPTAQLLNGTYTEATVTITINNGTRNATGSGEGFFVVKACANRPGYGYYNGASQKCPQGFYNAGGNDLPCAQCPPGTTTSGTATAQDGEADCGYLAPGYTINGLTEKAPVLCPTGTWNNGSQAIANIKAQITLDGICSACPSNTWTLEPGAWSPEACTLCAPGYGTNGTSCTSCELGKYGAATRSDTACQICPEATRTFTYAWPSDNVDTFYPAVTSPRFSKGLEDCIADFAQISNGAFFLDLLPDSACNAPTIDVVNGGAILNLQSCVAACAVDADCAAATFDYYTAQEGQQYWDNGTYTSDNTTCRLWKPATTDNTAQGGVAMKTMPAYNLALSNKDEAKKKDMGSGYYTQWIGSAAANCLNPASLTTVTATSTIQECYDACTAVNECAGVVYENATAIAVGCKLIMAKIEPGDSRRTLVKAVPLSTTTATCSAGERRKADSSDCEPCPDGQYWDEALNYGYSCKVCASPKVATQDKTKCLLPQTTCPAGTQFNPAKPDECEPCPTGTYKAIDDADGISRKCEDCTLPAIVSGNRSLCQAPAPCSRGLEWAVEQPGHCVVCEKDGFYKDIPDALANPKKCEECPTRGPGKFQNSYSNEHCINNCDGGYFYNDNSTEARRDPTKCQKCPWPQAKAGPGAYPCNIVCDVRSSTAPADRTTPNSDRTKCITPVICGRGEEFDKDFPEDVSKCKNCPPGYSNDDGVWLCIDTFNNTNATQPSCGNGTEVNPNRMGECSTCPFPLWEYPDTTDGSCNNTCGTSTPSSGFVTITNIGRDKDQFSMNMEATRGTGYTSDGLYCKKQCYVDQIWDGSACVPCAAYNATAALGGYVRPHGDNNLDTCTECTGRTIAYQGYCVTPIDCPINSQYDPDKPLDVDACEPCPAGQSQPDGDNSRCRVL